MSTNVDARRKSQREWARRNRLAHPDKVRAAGRRYHEAHKEARQTASRDWKSRNAEKVRAYRSAYFKANQEKEVESRRRWKTENPDRVRELDRRWRASEVGQKAIKAYRSSPSVRRRINARIRNRRRTDLRFCIEMRLRGILRQAIRRQGAPKSARFRELLGCSFGILKAHLESKFTLGMSWARIREIHIDHIKPCASFDLLDPAQQRACFHYTNLQPLWAEDNQWKGAR